MRAIKASNTRPEMVVRRICHSLGFRYRLNKKDLPGKPDLVFPRHKAVIFVNGCFWHRHDCYLFKLPETRRDFWSEKLEANAVRDQRKREDLIDSGWRILVIWECSLKGRRKMEFHELARVIDSWIQDPARPNASIDYAGVSVL